MAHSDRDQRGRRCSGKKCPESQNGGCVYCRTGEYKKPDRRATRMAGKKVVRRELHDAIRHLVAEAVRTEFSVTVQATRSNFVLAHG